MQKHFDRRTFLATGVSAGALWGMPRLPGTTHTHNVAPANPLQQDPTRVRDVVGASHGNFERVRELVEASPALAKANWDWGFGDWESALGAASHTGNAEIAQYLIDKGARPTIFSAAMLGQLTVVEAMVSASPGVQRIPGPHGIPLLAHARSGRDAARDVVSYLEELGDADLRPASVPVSDRGVYVGMYRDGPGPLDLIEVLEDRDALWLRRVEDARRAITHVGGHAFFPAGAPAVRIRFTVDAGRAVSLDVYDPDVILHADRE